MGDYMKVSHRPPTSALLYPHSQFKARLAAVAESEQIRSHKKSRMEENIFVESTRGPTNLYRELMNVGCADHVLYYYSPISLAGTLR